MSVDSRNHFGRLLQVPFIVCIGEKGRLTKEDLEAAILTRAHRLASAELMELQKKNDPTIHVCAWIGTSHISGYFMPRTASQCGHPFFFFRRSIPLWHKILLYGKHWLHFSGRLPWPHVPQLHQPSPPTAECQQRAQLPQSIWLGAWERSHYSWVSKAKQKRFRTELTDPAEKKSNVASRPCCCLIDVVVMFRRPCSSQR